MKTRVQSSLIMAFVTAGVLASAWLTIEAKDQPIPVDPPAVAIEDLSPSKKAEVRVDPVTPSTAPTHSIHDLLERPYPFRFQSPTRVSEVRDQLQKALKVPVVLDRAAMDRQDVRADDTVELELEGVRLRTGLKLLLSQVGLTYHVIAEDNLLLLTDEEGADDPLRRIFAEIKALHRDLHEVRDSVDEMREVLGLDEGAKMRKPTIIEEQPEVPADNVEPASPKTRARPGV
ncbi:hypothetical protein ACYOEI_38120 [Singulisphaera rosea]